MAHRLAGRESPISSGMWVVDSLWHKMVAQMPTSLMVGTWENVPGKDALTGVMVHSFKIGLRTTMRVRTQEMAGYYHIAQCRLQSSNVSLS